MIELIRIESDEDGWHLIVEGDLSDATTGGEWKPGDGVVDYANLRLSQDAAWALVDAVRPIAEWRAEGEIQKRNVAAGLDHEGRPRGPFPTGEELAAAADLERKRRRETPW